MAIQLGDRVKDQVTGLVGIAVGRTEWLSGCVRWNVQPGAGRDGKVPEQWAVDESQLRVLKAGVVKAVSPAEPHERPGGPMPAAREF